MSTKARLGYLLASTAIAGISSPTLAEVCYTVTGSVTTVNTSEVTQSGEVVLVATKANEKAAFDSTGTLDGTITGSGAYGSLLLTHKAEFPGKNIQYKDSFITQNDEAKILGIVDVNDDGSPCAFSVIEKITKIVQGSGFFEGVSNVNITAEGTVSYCSDNNQNSFTLSGQLCRD